MPDNLKRFLEFVDRFSTLFQACGKRPTLYPTLGGLDPANMEATGPPKIWTVGLHPILCAARCVSWCSILLENESGGQQSVVDDT